jgi:hemerythrin superfamily protein
MDAITMLKDDHHAVEKLFKDFEKAGDRAHVTKRKLVDRMIEELSRHAAIEEQLINPATSATIPEVEDQMRESIEEHHIVKWLLSELEKADVEDEQFDAKVTVLIENVRHHVTEEEDDYFPKVRDAWGRNDLQDLAELMVTLRENASPHPHPEAPMTPPANLPAGTVAATVDWIADTVSGLGQGGVAVVQDLVDRVRGTKTNRPSPTGSSTARKTAHEVRRSAGSRVDAAVDAVDEARRRGEKTTKTARKAVEDVSETARKGAKRTAKVGTGSR